MATGIIELAAVVVIAAVLGVIAKLLRQPVILAYLATGILIGVLGFTGLVDRETFHVFSDLGIMLVLFLVGLEVNYTSLRLVGKASLILGLGQVVFTAAIGYAIATALGFTLLPALYLAVALAFSSTVIVVKLLSDRNDLQSLYGRLSIGILLVQDFVAVLLLIVLAGVGVGEAPSLGNVALTIVEGLLLFGLMLILGRKALPAVLNRVARSEELLFLVSLAWLFAVAAAVSKIGFSIEIAGFLAGVALANSSEHFEIASRVRPLRDFFVLLFFAIVGSSVAVSNFGASLVPILLFSLFVLIGNPLVVLILMGLLGYRKRTSFLTGVSVAQISEFSLILVALGSRLGHVGETEVTIVTATALLTIISSTYLIVHAERIFRFLAPALRFFERRVTSETELPPEGFEKPFILLGCHRTGESIAMNLPREELLIVDFDPEVIRRMKARGFTCLFGDARDREILAVAHAERARLVVSTSPDLEDNLALLHELRSGSLPHPKIVARAESENEARLLYEKQADYVILPHFTAGQYFGRTVALDRDMQVLGDLKARDLALLAKHYEG